MYTDYRQGALVGTAEYGCCVVQCLSDVSQGGLTSLINDPKGNRETEMSGVVTFGPDTTRVLSYYIQCYLDTHCNLHKDREALLYSSEKEGKRNTYRDIHIARASTHSSIDPAAQGQTSVSRLWCLERCWAPKIRMIRVLEAGLPANT